MLYCIQYGMQVLPSMTSHAIYQYYLEMFCAETYPFERGVINRYCQYFQLKNMKYEAERNPTGTSDDVSISGFVELSFNSPNSLYLLIATAFSLPSHISIGLHIVCFLKLSRLPILARCLNHSVTRKAHQGRVYSAIVNTCCLSVCLSLCPSVCLFICLSWLVI
jgi:hypothetical protein